MAKKTSFDLRCPQCKFNWVGDSEAPDCCERCDTPADVYCSTCRSYHPVEKFDFNSGVCIAKCLDSKQRKSSPHEFGGMMGYICDALNGLRGDDQQRIAEVGADWVYTLLTKNKDYGGSAWETPCLAPHIDVRDALFCRMSDKVKRIAALSSGSTPKVNESLEDTVKDLGAYCLLWLARPGVNDEGKQ